MSTTEYLENLIAVENIPISNFAKLHAFLVAVYEDDNPIKILYEYVGHPAMRDVVLLFKRLR